MADKGKFTPFSVVPLKKFLPKSEVKTFAGTPELDAPIPTIAAYPTSTYVKENQAGMQIPIESIKALAKSEAEAIKLGLLPKGTTDYYLPSALVEGRWGDYGVNEVTIDEGTQAPKDFLAIAKVRDDLVKKAYKDKNITKEEYTSYKKYNSLDPSKIPGMDRLNELYYSEQMWDSKNPSEKAKAAREISFKLGFPQYSTDIARVPGGFSKQDTYYPKRDAMGEEALALRPNDLNQNAALKTLALVNKQKETGFTDPLQLWTAYNGLGVAKDKTGKIIASPDIYRARLNEAATMLNHPANAVLKTTYQDLVNGYLTGKIK